ncbi:MAG: hypothetical protein ABIR26_10390 [Ramlibacter sp.]
MKISQHMVKWCHFDSARARLDPVADFELWFWATLSGGTALINAALHAGGLTQENELLTTQIPYVYAVWGAGGPNTQQLARDSDLIHVDLPPIDGALPDDLERAFTAMRVIETYRDPCIRSDTPVTPEVVEQCVRSYVNLVEALGPRLQVHPS